MSEIKVGDFVSVNGYDHCGDYHDNEKGQVIEFYSHATKIAVKLLNTKLRVTPIAVHRKQCRKLVKIRRCDYCKGIGLIHPVGICDWCNGRGKVKI